MVVRKVIRNGQPDEATETKKEVSKPAEPKTSDKPAEQAEGDQEKKESPQPKPVVMRPRVRRIDKFIMLLLTNRIHNLSS